MKSITHKWKKGEFDLKRLFIFVFQQCHLTFRNVLDFATLYTHTHTLAQTINTVFCEK